MSVEVQGTEDWRPQDFQSYVLLGDRGLPFVIGYWECPVHGVVDMKPCPICVPTPNPVCFSERHGIASVADEMPRPCHKCRLISCHFFGRPLTGIYLCYPCAKKLKIDTKPLRANHRYNASVRKIESYLKLKSEKILLIERGFPIFEPDHKWRSNGRVLYSQMSRILEERKK